MAAEIAIVKAMNQVLWLDVTRTYIQEVGAMNVFLVKDDVLITPDLSGTILPGITRDSVIKLASSHFGMKVEERPVSIEEIIKGIKEKKVTDIFGSGSCSHYACRSSRIQRRNFYSR
jgi:branched-chain amino acid aminotransferase